MLALNKDGDNMFKKLELNGKKYTCLTKTHPRDSRQRFAKVGRVFPILHEALLDSSNKL